MTLFILMTLIICMPIIAVVSMANTGKEKLKNEASKASCAADAAPAETEESCTTGAPVKGGLFLVTFVIVFFGSLVTLFWKVAEAPPKYISKKLAASEAPECLQLRLEDILQRRPVTRDEVIETNKKCERATKQLNAIQSVSKGSL